MITATGVPVAAALLAVAAAVLAAVVVRRTLVHWTTVTSQSMLPTLRPGDRRLTVRARDLSRLVRGDVVVVRSDELGMDVVKRVIGLPGDRVVVAGDGTVEVNDAGLHEGYVAFPGGPGGRFHVPPGTLLVLGDNRAASHDARQWRDPYLPAHALRGRLVRQARRRTGQARAAAPSEAGSLLRRPRSRPGQAPTPAPAA